MSRRRQYVASLFLGLLLWGGCGPDSTLLVVEVTGRPATVKALRLTAELNGKRIDVPTWVSSNLDNFGLLLPAHSEGPFLLAADALDDKTCTAAQGKTDTTLSGSNRVRLTLPLTVLSPAICVK
jgi:hypothetical protein